MGFKVIENVEPFRKGRFFENSIRYAFADDETDEIYCYLGFYPLGDDRYEIWMQHTELFKNRAKSLIKIWKNWLGHMVVYEGKAFCVVSQNDKLVKLLGFSEDSPWMTILEEADGE